MKSMKIQSIDELKSMFESLKNERNLISLEYEELHEICMSYRKTIDDANKKLQEVRSASDGRRELLEKWEGEFNTSIQAIRVHIVRMKEIKEKKNQIRQLVTQLSDQNVIDGLLLQIEREHMSHQLRREIHGL
jgi:FtsZ-binding cell division protein ZapB